MSFEIGKNPNPNVQAFRNDKKESIFVSMNGAVYF